MKQHIVSSIKYFLGWPLALIALFFLGKFVLSQTQHVTWTLFYPNLLLVLLSILIFCGYFFLRSLFWQKLLQTQGHDLSLQETTYLWSVSELQRYIPGNVWSILGRTISFEQKNVSKTTTAKSWIYEAEFLSVASIFVSLLSAAFIIYGLLPRFALTHVLFVAVAVVTWGGVLFFLSNKLFLQNKKILSHILPPFSVEENFWLFSIMSSAMWLFGVGTYVSLISFTNLYPYDFNTFVGFFVFSFAVGYLSFIFPMGLGPREGMMTLGLAKYIPLSQAVLGAFFSRVLLIGAELVFLVVVLIWYRIPKKKLSRAALFLGTHKYLLLTLFFMAVYIVYFTTASFLRYDNFFAGRFDLGNMDQTVWNTIHGRIFQLTDPDGTNIISRLSVHADFILILLAPFYWLWQDPRMLLLIQTIVLAFGALFIYLLGKDILKNALLACTFALMYLLNSSVGYTNLYDFHGVTLATTFFLASFYFFKKQKTLLFLLFLLLAGTTKEEAWVVVALFGLYAAVIEKRKLLGSMIFLAGSSLFYFIFFKAIPTVRGSQHFAVTFYTDFGNSPTSILKTMLLSPQKTLITALQKAKLLYMFELLFPLGFLPLLSPLLLIFALPDLTINLLSSNTNYHEIYYQYTAVITAFLFLAALYGFGKVQKQFSFIKPELWMALLLCVSIISAYFYGPLPISRRASVDMFWLQQPNKTVITDFLNSIPRRYSIAATNNVGSHLSHRQLIYTIPTGIDKADILVFLLNDKFAQPSLPAQIKMTKMLEQDKRYVEAIHIGDFVVFEKKSIYPHARALQRPNSFFPTLFHTLRQTFSNKAQATGKSS